MTQKFEFNSPARTNGWVLATQPYAVYFTFTPVVAHTITNIKILVFRGGNPLSMTVRCTLADGAHKPVGPDLKSVVINPLLISNVAYVLYDFVFPTSFLVAVGTEYAVISSIITGGVGNRINLGLDDVVMTYPSIMGFTLDGINWDNQPTHEGFGSDTIKPIFEIWGNLPTLAPTAQTDPATGVS